MNFFVNLIITIHKKRPDEGVIGANLYVIALVFSNIISLTFLISSFLNLDLPKWDLTHNMSFRFFIGPVIIILLSGLFYLTVNKKVKDALNKEISSSRSLENNKQMWIYVIGSILFFFLSILSPLFK